MKCIKNQYLTEDKIHKYMCEYCKASISDSKNVNIKYVGRYKLLLCDSCVKNQKK